VLERALVQTITADWYAGTLKRRGWPWASWSAWKGCSLVRHFDSEIILLCVRWYLRFKLSLRDLVEMMAERGVALRIPPSCDGCSITHRSSKSAGRVMPLPSAGHGVSTRHTSRSRACDTIYIVPWTGRVGRLTSD